MPQPVTRNAQGVLQQAANQIQVYFTNDKLQTASAQNPSLYQLIFTNGTATTADDKVYNPQSVVYDPVKNMATLTFASSLDLLVSGTGMYRLRIGDNATPPQTVQKTVSPDQAGSDLSTSYALGALAATNGSDGISEVITGAAIEPPGYNGNTTTNAPYPLTFPGAKTDPGQSNVPASFGQTHLVTTPSGTPGITTLDYNFQTIYGTGSKGNALVNQITPQQEQDVRDIFSLWGEYLGVQFVETANQGLTVATGDPSAVASNVSPAINGAEGTSFVTVNGHTTSFPAAVVNNNSLQNWGTSEFGGAFFQVVMQQIGKYLGLGYSDDAPPGQVMGSTAGNVASGAVSTPSEPVFPGSFDIMDGQNLYRPDSKDINIYSFSLNQAGTFSAETIAQRLTNSSLLNTVVSLFDSSGNLLARNDDYFGTDSYLNLNLSSGQYFIAVTASGNTNFNPTVPDSGMGGKSQGAYELRLNFNPIAAGSQLVDLGGQPLDGDFNGVAGSDFNFWFQVENSSFQVDGNSNTIFVDKSASGNGSGPLGSITNPYNNIQTALAASVAGDIVRVEGNGGADGNVATLGDDLAYEIGRDIFSNPLSDGATLNVPKGTTLMIDAGAILKLDGANINAGTFAQGLDQSGSAIQVLGTPQQSVYFTSYNNSSIGLPVNPLPAAAAAPGDWGGLVFQNDSDHEQSGIFLNYVAHADISDGGGAVSVDGQQQVYDPIHLITARPTLIYNNIHNNADAAMSADPDSFQYTLIEGNTPGSLYTADYSRTGPVVHGNVLANDSINGLFIRIRTQSGSPIDVLDTTARLTSTDIVYALTENLEVQGNPGGPVLQSNGTLQARSSANLIIDPGVIVKSQGSRIEVGIGGQLLAEGTSAKPIIFTSLLDDSYGAGGVFDTTGDGSASSPAPGDWGGFFFNPASSGSFDHAEITYAGGVTPIEGGFASFNAVEIYQATVRIADSVLENNAGGADTTNRNGRGSNAAATIYVLGAQPVIVNNIFRKNAGDVISINANSLNAVNVPDWGRSTGPIGRFSQFDDNFGPLVRLNVLDSNDLNAMEVRGGTLDTQSIWDDTDIVHVLQSNIDIPNFESMGGLELKSSPTQSLVVKLSGSTAGFTADGTPLDISNRIGGALQVLGAPGHPVILTSLRDNTVGAGVDLQGNPVDETLVNGTSTANWQGITLTQYSNDRNVPVVNELESSYTGGTDINGTPSSAQQLGTLAPINSIVTRTGD